MSRYLAKHSPRTATWWQVEAIAVTSALAGTSLRDQFTFDTPVRERPSIVFATHFEYGPRASVVEL